LIQHQPLQTYLLRIGSNPVTILINDDLPVFFEEAAALRLREEVKNDL